MPGTNLTRIEAEARAELIKVSTYDIKLDLTQGERTFKSVTTINFSAREGGATFVDLIADKVHSVTLNGTALSTDIYVDSRLELANLGAENVLVVEADCAYTNTGEGMHRFVDPVDGEAYVYTQFEVPDARRVFAVFEQPDLKARFTFTVTVPDHWVVLSNSPTPEPVKADGKATFAFIPTEVMSSYITAIVAGPYQGVQSTIESVDGRVLPTGVYARASMMKHLDAENIFAITAAGFKFFEKTYDRAYPFPKYDHVFVPEYNAGAMENAGCITYSETSVFTSTPTTEMISERANVILHELAHMWFGDLITMKWWNDLWLNESFAEFMSHLAQVEGTEEFKDAWISFGTRKLWGMAVDQTPSTHPIVAEINDLADVEVNFDGITYAKGAAVLRQLIAYIGRAAFEAGLQSYFRKFEWGNTVLDDILTEFGAASGKDLQHWAKVWLEEAGITQLRTEVKRAEGEINELAIVQELVQDGTSYRPHATEVLGLRLEGQEYVEAWRLPVIVDGQRTVVATDEALPDVDAIILNSADEAYAKIRFDDQTLAHVLAHPRALTDNQARAVVATTLWDMLRDGDLSSTDYIAFALDLIPVEQNGALASMLIGHLATAATRLTPPAKRLEVTTATSGRLVEIMSEVEAGSSLQQEVASALITTANGEHLAVLRDFAAGRTINGFEISDKVRWRSLVTLAAAGEDVTAQLDEQLERDSTLSGREFLKAAQALADPAAAYPAVITDTSLSTGQIQQILRSWSTHIWRHGDAIVPVVADFWDRLDWIWDNRTPHMVQLLVTYLFPHYLAGFEDQLDVQAKTDQWLAEHADAPAPRRRLTLEGLDAYHHQLAAQRA